ncbi:Lcl domain-containing protein [Micavibrio aeruginosavorus]|nr:DUF1566 domain-containing protein [Micavibrio aeruginosavorus]
MGASRFLSGFLPVLGLFLLLCGGTGPAYAACGSPAGDAGDLIWSSAGNVPAYCNDTDWVAFPAGTGSAVPTQLGFTLNNPVASVSDFFGNKVAISGDLIVVGAHLEDFGGFSDSGAAYVFNASTGALVSTLNNPDPTVQDYFGISVAISGNMAVVGAYQDDPGGTTSAGTAYVFNATTGALVATLNKPVPVAYDLFGIGVGIDGNLAIVGAYHDDPGAVSFAGAAYVFNATTGALISTLVSPNVQGSGFFGNSVSISGNLAAVSANGEDPGGVNNAGAAYVFNATTGALVATLANPDPTDGDSFGSNIAINGNIVAVGAHTDDVGGTSDVGSAYTFNATTGALLATLVKPDPLASDFFGVSVSVSDGLVVVGSRQADVGGNGNAGAAYVFDATTGDVLRTLSNPAPAANDYFGSGVGLSGGRAVVGAFGKTPGAFSSEGAAYVFLPGTGGTGCLTPAGVLGDIVYNNVAHVLQYCDGGAWIAAGTPGNGGAGCVNPSGDAGDVVYNSTHHYLQYCEGDAWVGIGRYNEATLSPKGCSVIGDTCTDGTIYAGLTPDGNVRMYITAANGPTREPFNAGNVGASRTDTSMINCVTPFTNAGCIQGEANTAILVVDDSDSVTPGVQSHDAAAYCYNLVAHGRDDWYLPARNELREIFDNLGPVPNYGFTSTPDSYYYSSSEESATNGWGVAFVNGNYYAGDKANNYHVRCARK